LDIHTGINSIQNVEFDVRKVEIFLLFSALIIFISFVSIFHIFVWDLYLEKQLIDILSNLNKNWNI